MKIKMMVRDFLELRPTGKGNGCVFRVSWLGYSGHRSEVEVSGVKNRAEMAMLTEGSVEEKQQGPPQRMSCAPQQ